MSGGDVGAWEAAGLYDAAAPQAADRLALLEFLAEQGCDLEEMLEAHSRDRLFGLAGDRVIRPAGPRYDCEGAAEQLGTDAATVSLAWRSFGLPAPVHHVLGREDLEALRAWLNVRDLLGPNAATAFGRVLGSSVARLAEAGAAAMRRVEELDRGQTGSEHATARAYTDVVTALVPSIGVALDVVYRRHIDAARRHFELVAPTRDTTRCGIGFADLSGFTPMSQAKPLPELARLLAAFEQAATEIVHDGGGRVVKFLGDAVMFVSTTADAVAAIASDLVRHQGAKDASLEVRAGIAYGEVLAQDGDYFGPPVNLAARLVAAAKPGEVLAAPDMVPLLGPSHVVTKREARLLRGIEGPISPYAVLPA